MSACRRSVVFTSVLALSVFACKGARSRAAELWQGARDARPSPSSSLFPAGDPRGPHFRFECAVYHLPSPKADPIPAIREMARKRGLLLREGEPVEAPDAPTLAVRSPSLASYAPPDIESLRYSGKGLSEDDKKQLQASRCVTVLAVSGPSSAAPATYRSALEIAAELQAVTGGLLWDEETREVYTAQAWKRRLRDWQDGLPDVRRNVAIHVYRNGDLIRLVTLGMVKWALPDLVVNDAAASDTRPMGNLINLTCQLLIEGARLEQAGQMRVAIDAVRYSALRESLLGLLKEGATKRLLLTLAVGRREEGDAANRLMEITFPGPAGSLQERQSAAIVSLFGAHDSVVRVTHNAKLLDASRRAKAAVMALKPRYAKGTPDIESLLIKAPFKTPGGQNEWMWVEVVRWPGATIDGILRNDPFEVKGLKAGARVRVREGDIFDYILHKADGTTEGNETGKILEEIAE